MLERSVTTLLYQVNLGFNYELVKVNLKLKTWKDGSYNKITSKSYVPALITNDGTILTEVSVILEYIARQSINKQVLAEYASPLYWEQRMWLNYMATELHKNFISPFRKGNWLPNTVDSQKLVIERVTPRLKYVDENINQWKNDPTEFTIVDSYLFLMTTWIFRINMDITAFPHLSDFYNIMLSLSSVRETLENEGKPHSLLE